MSLKQWDRKIQALRADVTFLVGLQKENHDHIEEKIQSLQEKLPELQLQLEKRLSYIQSLAQRDKFLSSSEKAVLHWGRAYAQKAQVYYKDYLKNLLEVFWAELVQLRSASLTSRASDYFTKSKTAAPTPNLKQQSQLQQIRAALKKQAQSLQQRQAALEKRYLSLVLIKANRDASGKTQLSNAHLQLIQSLYQEQLLSQGLKTAPVEDKGSKKLATLSTPVLAAKPRDEPVYDPLEQAQRVQSLLNSFDFLGLEEELNHFEHKAPQSEFSASL